ncbi:MAG: alpha/beta hydrolase [Myxococcaceae bacterium]
MSHVQVNRGFESRAEGFPRTVRIYTPDAYDHDPLRRFPVLYMMDGQNVFAHHESAVYDTWCANQVLDRLVFEGALEPWLIVAVDSGAGRMEDYSPFPNAKTRVAGRGDRYARFLCEELKPWVDRTYRTRPEPNWTGVMGSSLGGLISLYLGLSRPEIFGRVGALSPTVMWGGNALFKEWKSHSRLWSRIYLDAGLSEFIHVDGQPLDYGQLTRDFYFHLKELGYEDHELFLVLEPGGAHHEKDWHRRLPLAFRWLLG